MWWIDFLRRRVRPHQSPRGIHKPQSRPTGAFKRGGEAVVWTECVCHDGCTTRVAGGQEGSRSRGRLRRGSGVPDRFLPFVCFLSFLLLRHRTTSYRGGLATE